MTTHVTVLGPAPPGAQATSERKASTVQLARSLETAARDLRTGATDPLLIAGRLERLSRNVDPTITVTLTR